MVLLTRQILKVLHRRLLTAFSPFDRRFHFLLDFRLLNLTALLLQILNDRHWITPTTRQILQCNLMTGSRIEVSLLPLPNTDEDPLLRLLLLVGPAHVDVRVRTVSVRLIGRRLIVWIFPLVLTFIPTILALVIGVIWSFVSFRCWGESFLGI